MTKRRILTVFGMFAAGTLVGLPARAAGCPGPKTDNQASGDALYGHYVNCRQTVINGFVSAHDMQVENWTQMGWEDPCNQSLPFARTLNALFALNYSSPNPQCATCGGNDVLAWAGAFARESFDELDGGCTDPQYPTAFAHTFEGNGDDKTNLYNPFFFFETVPERAGTLLHEATHAAGYWHSNSTSCPRGTACDASFPMANSPNSNEVSFLTQYSQRGFNANWMMKDRARDFANVILDTAFVAPPTTRVTNWPDVPLIADLNGDGREDLVIYRQGAGTWWGLDALGLLNGVGTELINGVSWGGPTDIPFIGDIDRDGKPDLLFYRTRNPADLDWRAAPSSGFWFAKSFAPERVIVTSVALGSPGNPWVGDPDGIPLVGDLNNDDATDFIVYEPEDGSWWAASGAEAAQIRRTIIVDGLVFGKTPGCRPLIGDFDQDGADDIAVFRPDDGTWHARSVFKNQKLFGPIPFGENGDIPIVGDFDGDGFKDDLGIYRPRNGEWHARSSLAPANTLFFGPITYGGPRDMPFVATVRPSDGRQDPVIYRPYDGTWFALNRSTNPVSERYAWVAYGQPY
jgi:hypothetical protein